MNKNSKQFVQHQSGFVPVIMILIIIVGFVGTYFLGTLKNKPLTNVVSTASPYAVTIDESSVSKPITTPDTPSWQEYTNTTLGFSVMYPAEWRVLGDATTTSFIGFGPINLNDTQWVITINSHRSTDEIAADMGKQFSDRKEQRRTFKINNREAIEIIVTTPSEPNWIFRQILIPINDITFAFSNGAIEDNRFVSFYNSFVLTK